MSLTALVIAVPFAVSALLLVAAFRPQGDAGLARRARALRNARVGPTPGSRRAEAQILQASDTRLDRLAQRFLPRPALLRTRLEATGAPISLGLYAGASLATTVVVSGVLMAIGASAAVALLFGLAAGVWLPHQAVGILIGRRRAAFFKVFAEAVALIVRGLRAGLPVTEGVAIVGREIADPVGEEFRRMSDQVRLGRSLEDAMWQSARRLDLPEFNFLAVSVSVQRETGGNLAETLDNLGLIVRRRQQMRLKIKAMASEATASALIIGCLPFVMGGLMSVFGQDYLRPLFVEPLGRMMLAGGTASLLVGGFVMRQMVRFEI